jgi:large subunit ribosomal protein L25
LDPTFGDCPMLDVTSVQLAPREVTGKKVKKLRRQGLTPVHVYGGNGGPESLQVDALVLGRLLAKVGRNIPVSVEVDGNTGASICLVREVQRNPVSDEVVHVDFLRVDIAQRVRALVPVALIGEPPALRLNGTLIQPLQSIEVESLPLEMPTSIEVDVSGLDDFEKAMYVRDVTVAAEATVISDPDAMIARVEPPRVIEEDLVVEEPEEGLEEGEEGAEAPAEGEAAPEAG